MSTLAALLLAGSCATNLQQAPVVVIEPVGEPIILVHGFGGWGRDGVPGFYYWGGFTDLEAELRARGYNVMTAEGGPFSSNWDRACELYAHIKGGVADYGERHAAEHGHRRFGREYESLYPQWSAENKVHIIGHSMGGTTARLLAYLLEHGDLDEAAVPDASELFSDGEQWIASITTIAAPHNGTTVLFETGLVDFLVDSVTTSLGVIAETDLVPGYNTQLEHWGLERAPDERLLPYLNRIRRDRFWGDANTDSAISDLTVDRMREFNAAIAAESDVHYFSWAIESTIPGVLPGRMIPEFGMLPLFAPSAIWMGGYQPDVSEMPNDAWAQNDGVVNTVSMAGPTLGSDDIVVPYDGTPESGVWNYMGLIESTDHADIIGIPLWVEQDAPYGRSVVDFYAHVIETATRVQ